MEPPLLTISYRGTVSVWLSRALHRRRIADHLVGTPNFATLRIDCQDNARKSPR
jgi:hypothetical protein